MRAKNSRITLAAALLVAARAVNRSEFAQCGLPIPNSGGAQRRPSASLSFDAPELLGPGQLMVESVINWTGNYSDVAGPVEQSVFCGGHGTCEAECCKRPDCVAWGWTVAGSVHAQCGGQECQLYLSTQPPEAWNELTSRIPLTSGYNVHGYLFSGADSKRSCCEPSPSATPVPPAKDVDVRCQLPDNQGPWVGFLPQHVQPLVTGESVNDNRSFGIGFYCGGVGGCESECCGRDGCVAWGFVYGGAGGDPDSCGGDRCTVYTLTAAASAESDWTRVASQLSQVNPNVIQAGSRTGYVFPNPMAKEGCCVAPPVAGADGGCGPRE